VLALPFVLCTLTVYGAAAIRTRSWRNAAGAGAVSVVCVLAFLPWCIRLLGLAREPKELRALGADQIPPLFAHLLLARETRLPGLVTLAVVLAVILLVAGLVAMHRRSEGRVGLLLLLASTAAILATQALLDHYKPSYQPRNLLFLHISLLCLVAYASVSYGKAALSLSLPRIPRSALALLALLPVCALAIAMTAITSQNLTRGYGKEPWRQAVEQVSRQMRPGDVTVFYADYMAQCWRHYYTGYDCCPRRDIPTVEHGEFRIPRVEDTDQFDAAVTPLLDAVSTLRAGNSVWAFYSHVSDPQRIHDKLTRRGLIAISTATGPSLSVVQYRLVEAAVKR
jgi:hypothetical protein